MATNKKFRIQNGVDIKGEMSFNNQTIIDENGNVAAGSIETGVHSLVNQEYVNGLNVTASDALTAQSVTNISGFSTTDVSEGANLYFTSERARGAVQGGQGITYNQVTGEFSTNLTGGDGVSVVGSTISIDGSAISQDLVPAEDDVYSLGSPDKVWRDVYIGPGSLYINGTKILEDNSGTITMYADAGQNLSFGTSGGGVIDLNAGDEFVQVKSNFILSSGKTITTVGGGATQFGGDVELNGNCIFGLATPQTDGEAANKGYVDGLIAAGTISGDKTFSDNVVVAGDLTVQGTTTTVNSETISLADNIIDLNSNATTGTPTENGGVRVMRGDEPAAQIRWNEAMDHWEVFDGSSFVKIALSTSDLEEGTNKYFTDERVNAIVGPIEGVLQGADSAERASRIAADSDLQSQITNHIAAQDLADSDFSLSIDAINASVADHGLSISGIDTDISNLETADSVLQTNIDNEVTARIDGDLALEESIRTHDSAQSDALAVEVAARIAGDSDLQSNLNGETSARVGADSDLQSNINAEEQARSTADSQLQSAIDGLTVSVGAIDTGYRAGDSDLSVAIGIVDDKVQAILGTSPETLDTLQEIVAAFEGADGSLQGIIDNNSSRLTTVEGKVNVLEGEMDDVEGRASNLEISVGDLQSDRIQDRIDFGHGDSALRQDLTQEIARATAAEGLNADNIAQEILDRGVADTGLQDNIDTEETARIAGDAALQLSIGITDTGYRNADSDLRVQLDAEIYARQSGDSDLLSMIDSDRLEWIGADSDLEVRVSTLETEMDSVEGRLDSDRLEWIGADSDLDERVSTLESYVDSDRGVVSSLDSALRTLISDETTARTLADTGLQNQIDFIKTNTDSAALDSLAEIVAAFQNADGDLITSVTANGNDIDVLQAEMFAAQGSISDHSVSLSDHANRIGLIENWDTDNLPEGGNKYWTPERTKAVLSGGLCITYNEVTGEIKVDENEAETSLTVAESHDANALGGQAPSHYRIDIYDINGTVVN